MTEATTSNTEVVLVDPIGGHASLSLLAALEDAGAVINKGLELPPDLSYDKYEAIGLMLSKAGDMVLWLIGDWLNYGEHTYGQKYAQAAELLGYTPQSMMNVASLAHRVKPKQRSRILKFWVHEPVAKLGPAQQRALLKQAEEEGLSRSDLRRIVKGEPPEERYQDVSRDLCSECGRPLP